MVAATRMQMATAGVTVDSGVTPDDIADLVGRWDFSDISKVWKDTARTDPVVADADQIAGVTDLSGTGLHLSQGTVGSRPRYKENIFNGKSVCRLDGSDDVMQSANWTQAQPYSIVIILGKRTVAAGTETILSASTASQFGYVGQHAAISDKLGCYAGSFVSSGVTFADTGVHFVAAVFNGASSKIQIDGTAVTGNAGAGAVSASPFLFGADNAGGSNDGDYDVGEMFIHGRAYTADQITDLRAYAQSEWGAP